MAKYDFTGWATRNDIKCSDGRTIRRNAFKDNDGETVPLVWNHSHNDPMNVLGHALLENRDEGVYVYGTFNDSAQGKNAKELVEHGDVTALSIYANHLKQHGGDVLHGAIREVSLVLAGANPGAFIDSIMMHGEESDEEAVIYTGEELTLSHADDEEDKNKEKEKNMNNEQSQKKDDEKTVKDVFDSMTDEQKTVVYAMIGQALEDAGVDADKGDEEDMKHNVFDTDEQQQDYLTHSDQGAILEMAKKNNVGSFKRALEIYSEENGVEISHADTVGGFIQTGAGNVTELFPEYKDVRPGAPELITNDQGWVNTVLQKVHKSPISRIRTRQVDIRNIQELRAKGYQKGKQKKLTGNFKLVTRTTDPQTVYVRNSLHRDDVVDITDFDYVDYLYNIDKMSLNEELATAIMLGDGRDDGAEDKISPDHIRPIWTDDDLYTLHVDINTDKTKSEIQGTNSNANFGENFIMSETMVNTILYAREHFKGSGTPDLYITPHMLNVMLLARDINGRRIYSSKAELASSLNVGEIYTCEQFEGKTRKDADQNTKGLIGIICNLADYSLGATKGGEVTHFTDFDIDFNQLKSLLETRCSGALTRCYSAIAIEEMKAKASTESEVHQ
nr:MAG TPA: major capsid protein [Bacteriophage sp.]